MIDSIKEAIASKLKDLYPKSDVCDERVKQKFEKGSFFIDVIDHDYTHSLFNSGSSRVVFDITYYPKDEEMLKTEINTVKNDILRAFRMVGDYRTINKTSNVVDDVLHIQMSVSYREEENVEVEKINNYKINEALKEE